MIARLRTLLSRFGRRPPAREIILPPFHPIIFANGRDDDTEGLKAFIEARPVIHAGRLIGEGVRVNSFAEEPLSLEEVFMMITKGVVN